VVAVGEMSRAVCGGLDGGSLIVTSAPVSVTLPQSAPLSVDVEAENGSIDIQQLVVGDLPSWLPSDWSTRVFEVKGSLGRPEGLSEIYHP
jgi:hypothetical protein